MEPEKELKNRSGDLSAADSGRTEGVLDPNLSLFYNNASFVNYWAPYFHNDELMIAECGYEKCSPLHYFGPDKKNFHVLHYILSGSGTVTMDGITCELHRGDGFYIPPNKPVHYQASRKTPWEYRWLGVIGAQAGTLFEKTSLAHGSFIFHYDRDSFFTDNLKQIYDYSLDAQSGELLMLGQFIFFMAGIIQRFPNPVPDSDTAASYIKQALAQINKNFTDENCTVNRIARELNLSRCYLYKLFMRYVGINPVKYITEVRVSTACRILQQNNYSVKEVAMMVGYHDATYFSRVFTKEIGQTPSQYARKLLAQN